MEHGDLLRSFYDPFIHIILSLLLTSDVCWTLWLSNERNSCRAVVGCLSKVFSLRKDRCSNIFATSLQKAFNEESCSTDGPRATKVRGDLGFVYLFIIGSHADKGCRPNRGRWCAWEKVMWKIFDLCGLCGLGGGFVGLCWRAQVIHQSASTPRSAWLHSQSATMYIVFEMPLHLLWKRPHNSFLKFSWSNFRFPGAAGMTSVKNVLRIWIKIGVRIINSWPTIHHLTLHILEAWFWILWVLTHFDHFWSIFPIQKTISARPSLWRARCWTSRPPAVRHRSRWSCWVGAAWPPPGPHRPRWSAPTSAHAASTGPLGTLALKFSAIFGHFNAYCIFSYK